MPKLKTHSGAKKRFNLTANGKVKRARAFKSHILTKKTTKRTRHLRATAYADQVGGQAVLGRQTGKTTPWLTERHGYDPTCQRKR